MDIQIKGVKLLENTTLKIGKDYLLIQDGVPSGILRLKKGDEYPFVADCIYCIELPKRIKRGKPVEF